MLLEVSRAAFYEWIRRILSARKRADVQLLEKIETIQGDSKGTYGSRVCTPSCWPGGEVCEANLVARLMQANGNVGRAKRRFKLSATRYIGRSCHAQDGRGPRARTLRVQGNTLVRLTWFGRVAPRRGMGVCATFTE